MNGGRSPRVVVVGAGIAGLACARALQGAGATVVVLDKGRHPGGRVATRRVGDALWNHGSQYATAVGDDLARELASLADEGVVAPWHARGLDHDGKVRWSGAPAMNALPAALARGIDVRCSITVQHLDATAQHVTVVDHQGQRLGPFDRAVVTAPPPQAIALAPALADRLSAIVHDPCWAALLVAPQAAPLAHAPLFDALRLDDGPLAWVAREASRPGAVPSDRWVAHASPTWSRAHLEAPAEVVARALATAFEALTGVHVAEAVAHRWRYARVARALGAPCAVEGRWVYAGDGCLGPRIEAAWASGVAAAAAALA